MQTRRMHANIESSFKSVCDICMHSIDLSDDDDDGSNDVVDGINTIDAIERR